MSFVERQEEEEDRIAQQAIRSAAFRSLAILEKAFIRNGSGRYLILRSATQIVRRRLKDREEF